MSTDAERGWVEVGAVLSASACESLIGECMDICADPTNRHPRDKPVAGTIHLEELDQRIDTLAHVLKNRDLLEAVEGWFGPRAWPGPSPMQVSLRAPGPGYGEQDLHRDAMEGLPLASPEVVTAIVALTDFTDANGATRIIPGSHRSTQRAASFRARRHSDDEVILTGAAGTAFVFNGHALHGGGHNTSTAHRYALQIVWRRSLLDG